MALEYVATQEGREVHLMSPAGGAEATLCGIAFDAADSEGDESLRFSKPRRRAITCVHCANVARVCKKAIIA